MAVYFGSAIVYPQMLSIYCQYEHAKVVGKNTILISHSFNHFLLFIIQIVSGQVWSTGCSSSPQNTYIISMSLNSQSRLFLFSIQRTKICRSI